MNKTSGLWPALAVLFAAVIFGSPVFYAVLYHPVSRMAETPAYKGLTENSFLVMSPTKDLAAGRLIRFTTTDGRVQIRRIVALAGDEVGFRGDTLSVNGKAVGEYPAVRTSESVLIVPPQTVFYFPDFIPADSGVVELPGVDKYLLPEAAIDATVLHTFDNGAASKQYGLLAQGAAAIGLYGLAFFACGRGKALVAAPLYWLARIGIGLNVLVWTLLGLYGMSSGLWGVFPVIYQVLLSWLSFLGLSIAGADAWIWAVGLIGVLALFSDEAISGKAAEN